MTKITKPIERETDVYDRSEPLIITLQPKYLTLRRKNSKAEFLIPYEQLWNRSQLNGKSVRFYAAKEVK